MYLHFLAFFLLLSAVSKASFLIEFLLYSSFPCRCICVFTAFKLCCILPQWHHVYSHHCTLMLSKQCSYKLVETDYSCFIFYFLSVISLYCSALVYNVSLHAWWECYQTLKMARYLDWFLSSLFAPPVCIPPSVEGWEESKANKDRKIWVQT